jgi:UDP-N-acetylglucosamine 2-epimerase
LIRLLSIVGARPQFIKAAPVSLAIQRSNQTHEKIEDVIVHTGQHYDENMSDIFFKQLSIPEPAYNLHVGSGTHAEQTGLMLKKIEEVLLAEKPDMILVYGDTNSTLAGALAASKLSVPLAHVEAGLRSFNRKMPEEINRIVTDRLSDILFCPTKNAVDLLKAEGISRNVHLTGDVMYDAALIFSEIAEKNSAIMRQLSLEPKSFFLATIHRAENTDDPAILKSLIRGLSSIEKPVILPAHPRLRAKMKEHRVGDLPGQIRIIDPVSFLDMIRLEKYAAMVLTDSGGVQKEAYFYKTPCITLRNETEWIETLENQCNVLAGCDPKLIKISAARTIPETAYGNSYGNGKAADELINIIIRFFGKD